MELLKVGMELELIRLWYESYNSRRSVPSSKYNWG